MLRFHQATCELLGLAPIVDEAARAAISDRERRLGVMIPAAVAEWYTLRGAVEIRVGASADDAMGIQELGEPFDGWGQWTTGLCRRGSAGHSHREPGCVPLGSAAGRWRRPAGAGRGR